MILRVQGLNLTERELDVLDCVLQAMGCKQTARHLGIGEHTLRKHRGSLLRKFGVRNVVELVAQVTAVRQYVPTVSDQPCRRWPVG
ncbi:transcriptional regulator NarP [compost metagenome]